jgi:hypothetical protein
MHNSTFSSTSAPHGVGGQRHAPAALPPVKARYPLCRRLDEPQGRSGRVRNISPPLGFDLRTVQPVASRYNDCAIPAGPLSCPDSDEVYYLPSSYVQYPFNIKCISYNPTPRENNDISWNIAFRQTSCKIGGRYCSGVTDGSAVRVAKFRSCRWGAGKQNGLIIVFIAAGYTASS